MIVDGKAVAQEILTSVAREVRTRLTPPRLTVFTCAPNFETQKFLQLKQKRAQEVGINIHVVELPPVSTTDSVLGAIRQSIDSCDGIVVQLPFPDHIDTPAILQAIPRSHDIDVLQYCGEVTDILPPVVGAIDAIAEQYSVHFTGAQVVVVGQGRLVGAPAAAYARSRGGVVTIIEKDTRNTHIVLKMADILILGAGVPGLVMAADIKTGVAIFDAGTSEEGGMLVGDAAADVESKASLLTPVPGGIGPITIAVLLQNLVRLTART